MRRLIDLSMEVFQGMMTYPNVAKPVIVEMETYSQMAKSVGTDVYGVGLTLYEMLLGQPAFTYKLQSDAQVYDNVVEDRRNKLLSIEVTENVSQIVLRAVNNDRQVRQQTVADLAEQLIQQFGPVPAEKKSRLPGFNTIFLVVGAFLIIAILIALAVSLSGIRG